MDVNALRSTKRRNGDRPLVVMTAYDAPTARAVDAAGVDIILVGDSLGDVVLGYENTMHVTMSDMVSHVRAVASQRPQAHVVADMPWMSYHLGPDDAVRNAAALVRAGAQSVKLEGGRRRGDVVAAILDAEIPVMGHLGLTPQSVLAMGGFKVQAKTRSALEVLKDEALFLQETGVYAIVIEAVPPIVGREVTAVLDIPTIGIGAGPDTDGQVLVVHDIVGLSGRSPAKFVRQYVDLDALMRRAVGEYADDVRNGRFPGEGEVYATPEELRD